MMHPLRGFASILLIFTTIFLFQQQESYVNPFDEDPIYHTLLCFCIGLMVAEIIAEMILYTPAWLSRYRNLFDVALVIVCGIVPLFFLQPLSGYTRTYRFIFAFLSLRCFKVIEYVRSYAIMYDLRWVNLVLLGYDHGLA